MLYTRTGDNGTSGLFGTAERLSKDSPVYDVLGALDEINSLLGYCRGCALKTIYKDVDIAVELVNVQQCLFIMQAEIAGAKKTITQNHIEELEHAISTIEALIEDPKAFIIPGATELSGLFDFARAVCRRVERVLVGSQNNVEISGSMRAYINRLSSLLYVLARYTATQQETKELSPLY